MFVGRKKELAYLEDIYNKGQSNILCMYGHKGIGKTSLVLNFVNNKNAYYLSARPCSEEEQLGLFFNENNIEFNGALSFYELFNRLSFDGNGKKILVIDEFQNIVKVSDNFMPELVRFVSSQLDGILVILCSSSISFVENSLVPKIGQLAQSFSAFYKVHPLSFMDCVNYFSAYDTESCIQVYSLLGGNPLYWNEFSDKLSVEDNIKKAFLDVNAKLRYEGLNVVTEELREINVYSTILYCLANGMNKLNDLHTHTGYSRAKISVYIKNLIEREIVEKVFSYDNASSANAMKGVYRISSPYLHFYFRFLFKFESRLAVLGKDKFYEQIVKPGINDFYEEHFATVCTEFLTLLNQMNKLPIKASHFGEWVGKKGKIDVILQNDDDDSLLCFCSYKKANITLKDYKTYLSIANDARLHVDYMIILANGQFEEDLLRLEKSLDNLQLIKASTL